MPRKYVKKKTIEKYSKRDLSAAVEDVKNENCTYRQASARYNVPVAVIYHRIKGRKVANGRVGGGRSTALTMETEELIVECLKARANMGYPCNKEELQDLVAIYVKENNIKTPFKNDRPGVDWYYNFMKRHPSLSFKKPEHLQKARKTQRKPDVIYGFYDELTKVILEKKINRTSFVFNADESGFGNDPSRIKAIGERGKTLSRVSGGSGRESTSVLACIAADGSYLPPFIIFKGAAVQARWTSENSYPGTVYSVSTNGWMEEPQFFTWFSTVFVKWIAELRKKLNQPGEEALLMYDGHKSHISLRIITCAIANKVTLVKFPSHLTDKLQPLDKCVFGPVKTCWEKILIAHGKKQMGRSTGRLKKNEFTELLGIVWKEAFTVNNIKNAFVSTGVFPVDPTKFSRDEFDQIELRKYEERRHKTSQVVDGQTLVIIGDTHVTPEPQASTSGSTSTRDIVTVFQSALISNLSKQNDLSTKSKTVTPRLKQQQYGEVLTTDEVRERLEEAERLKAKKNEPKTRKKGTKKGKKVKGPRKENVRDKERNEQKYSERESSDNDDENDWSQEVIRNNLPEVEYIKPDWETIQPQMYILAKFLGGPRNSTTFKYVCRVNAVDSYNGDIEVVGYEYSIEFVENSKDISYISMAMIEAVLPNPQVMVKSRKNVFVFPGPISVFEK